MKRIFITVYLMLTVFFSVSIFSCPLEDYLITSGYGEREGGFHRGIDIAAEKGEEIYAVKRGTVEECRYNESYGYYVVIKHRNIESLYAHMEDYCVEKGEKVKRGQVIGYAGDSGNAQGVHLHFELRKGKKVINPEIRGCIWVW